MRNRKTYLTKGKLDDMGMGKIYFTKKQKSVFRTKNIFSRKSQTGKNGVWNVNYTWILILGIVLGLLLPFLIDWALFGTPTPCTSVKVFEDGSSILKCEVRN